MRALVTIAVLACALAAALCPSATRAQGLSAEEAQTLREDSPSQRAAEPARASRSAAGGPGRPDYAGDSGAAVGPVGRRAGGRSSSRGQSSGGRAAPGARELDQRAGYAAGREGDRAPRQHLQTIRLPKPESAASATGFFVGSANFRRRPRSCRSSPAARCPSQTGQSFRFDKFGFGVSRAFADWLASAAVESRTHRDA